MSFDIGDVKRLRLSEVRDESGDLADPGEVAIAVKAPSGAVTTYTLAGDEVQRDKLGYFYFDLALAEQGVYEYRWKVTGGVDLAEAGALLVGPDPILEPFADSTFTVADVWRYSPALQARFPVTADGTLSDIVATVAPLVGSMTGRAIAGTEGEAVPDSMRTIMLTAIAMKANSFVNAAGSAEAAEAMIERSGLRSISAGSWSESYFGPGEAARGKVLDADPVLHELLWALSTEEKKAEWIALWDPEHAPGFSVVESFDYGQRPGGY